MTTVHGTCLVVVSAGLLLRGPSGAGKSDLALRLIHGGNARLVADDQVRLQATPAGVLCASPPELLAGRIEVRGIGILDIEHEASCRVDAVIDLVPREAVERLPETEQANVAGVVLPRFCLHAFDASAPARLHLIARRCLTARPEGTAHGR
jgi:HPr kinase/phosphorylase